MRADADAKEAFVRDLENEIFTRKQELIRMTADRDKWMTRAGERQKQYDEATAQLVNAGALARQKEVDALRILRDYDRITLNLALYFEELEGFRDTAKTKTERVVLGHVVERLKTIHANKTEQS